MEVDFTEKIRFPLPQSEIKFENFSATQILREINFNKI